MGDAIEAEFCGSVSVYDAQVMEYMRWHTDGMDDLVDHLFAKLEFFVLALANVLGDDCATVHFRVGEGRPAICLAASTLGLVLIVIQLLDSSLANATVALCPGLVVLPTEVKRLQEQHNRHLNHSQQNQNDLHSSLSRVELLLDSARLQEHVDQHVEKARRRLPNRIPINAPFVDDGKDQVPKDGLKEYHARNEVAEDVDGAAEVACVDI